jgi:murein DD-endopeptidase MepM/ murein hydrolase activator NlpD
MTLASRPAARSPTRPRLEVQFHPGDIRGRVRYLFVTDRLLRVGLLSGGLYLVLLAGAAWLAPGVLRGLVGRHEYESLVQQRILQGERLKASVARLDELRASSESLRLRMAKIHLAYGLGDGGAIGQGGFPFGARAVPESIYASIIRRGNHLESSLAEELRVLETFLAEVQAFENAHHDQIAATPSTCPLQGDDFVLTSPFGTRRNPFTKGIDFHAGLDFAAPVGHAVHAPADGRVVFAGRYPLSQSVAWWRYGNLVALRHGDRFVTLFGHLDSVAVRAGQQVAQGDLLGGVGNTGWSTSPHLHYELRRRDDGGALVPVDPRIYILDHRWRDDERLLVQSRPAPAARFEPLPAIIGRP